VESAGYANRAVVTEQVLILRTREACFACERTTKHVPCASVGKCFK
jgi:hypothetical protein